MNYFSNYLTNFFTNIGLKRVCKFILKRALGQFLLNDLDIEQFEVLPNEGIRIKNIELDSAYFNYRILRDSPVKCVSVVVTEVDIFISISRVFNDSCHVVVKKLDIVLAPDSLDEFEEEEKEEDQESKVKKNRRSNKRYTEKVSKFMKGDSESESESDFESDFESDNEPEEDNEGLDYIASWIENFLLRLRGTVELISINVLSKPYKSVMEMMDKQFEEASQDDLSKSSLDMLMGINEDNIFENSLQLEMKDINFFNMDPQLINPTNQATDTPSPDNEDISTRQLDVGSILFGHIGKADMNSNEKNFLKFFEIKDMNHIKFISSYQLLDMILTLPTIELVLNSQKISGFLSFYESFLSVTSSGLKSKSSMKSSLKKKQSDINTSNLEKSFFQRALEETSPLKSIELLEKELKKSKKSTTDSMRDDKLLAILSHIKKLQNKKMKESASMYSSMNDSTSDLVKNTQLNSSPFKKFSVHSSLNSNFGEHYDTDFNFDFDEEEDSNPLSESKADIDSCMFFSTKDNNRETSYMESSMYESSHISPQSSIEASTYSSSAESSFKLELTLSSLVVSIVDEENVECEPDQELEKILKLSLLLNNIKLNYLSGNTKFLDDKIKYISGTFDSQKNIVLKSFLNLSVESIDLISQEFVRNPLTNMTSLVKDYKLFGFLDHASYQRLHDNLLSQKMAISVEIGFSSSMFININCLPIILSINIGVVNRWVSIIKKIFPLTQTSESSLASLSIKLSIPFIDLILQCDERYGYHSGSNSIENFSKESPNFDPNQPNCFMNTDLWDQVDEVLRLDLNPKAWTHLSNKSHSIVNSFTSNANSSSHYLNPFLTHLNAGFLLHFKKISLKFSTNLEKESDIQVLEIEEIKFSLVFYSLKLSSYYSSLIFSINSDEKLKNLIKLEKIDQNLIESSDWGNKSAILSSNSSNSTTIAGLTTSQYNMMNASHMYTSKFPTKDPSPSSTIGPLPPQLKPNQLLQLSAYSIEADIQKREFSMLSLFGDCLIYKSDSENTNSDSSTNSTSTSSSSSFGMIISTRLASISFSENDLELWESLLKSFKGKENADYIDKDSTKMTYRSLIKQLTSILVHLRTQKKKDHTSSNIKNKKLKIIATIRKPRFELFSTSSNIFLGIKANDVSFYEMTPAEYSILKEKKFNFHKPPTMTQGGRQGESSFDIPFIHRAYGWKEGITPENSNYFKPFSSVYDSKEVRDVESTLLGNHNDYGHAFEIKILFSTIKKENSLPLKSVKVFIDFYDIVLCHDPQSLWIFKMISVISPKRPLDIMAKNLEDFFYQISLYKKYLSQEDIVLLSLIKEKLSNSHTYKHILQHISSNSSAIPENNDSSIQPPTIPFETTSVIVRIRDLLIDHPSPLSSSRSILSIGTLTISTNLVSSSPKYSLKISLDKLIVYIRKQSSDSLKKFASEDSSICPPEYLNYSSQPSKKQTRYSNTEKKSHSIGWLSHWGFLPIISLDFFNCLITLSNILSPKTQDTSSSDSNSNSEKNDKNSPATSIAFTIGSCIFQGSLDTIELGIKEYNLWLKETQKMANIIEKRTDLKTSSSYYYYYLKDENNSIILFRFPKEFDDKKWKELEYKDDYFIDQIRICEMDDEEQEKERKDRLSKEKTEQENLLDAPVIIPSDLLEGPYPYLVPNNTALTSDNFIEEESEHKIESVFLSESQYLKTDENYIDSIDKPAIVEPSPINTNFQAQETFYEADFSMGSTDNLDPFSDLFSNSENEYDYFKKKKKSLTNHSAQDSDEDLEIEPDESRYSFDEKTKDVELKTLNPLNKDKKLESIINENVQKKEKFFSILEPGLIGDIEEKDIADEENEVSARYFCNFVIEENYIKSYSIQESEMTDEDREFEDKLQNKHTINNYKNLKSKFVFTLLGDFRFRIYSGKEWEDDLHPSYPKQTSMKSQKVSFSDSSSSTSNLNTSSYPTKSSLKQNNKKENTQKDNPHNAKSKIKRAMRDSIDVFARKVNVKGTFYDDESDLFDGENTLHPKSTQATEKNIITPLSEKIILSIQDFLVTYRHSSNMDQQKVIGPWNSFTNNNEAEYQINESSKMINFRIEGYKEKTDDENAAEQNVEYRCCISLSPIRVFLNDYIINFFANYYTLEKQKLNEEGKSDSDQESSKSPSEESSTKITSKSKSSSIYFQHLYIYGLALKIDYPPDLRSPALPSNATPYSIASVNSLSQITNTVLTYLPSVILLFLKVLMPRGGVTIMLRPVRGRGLFADDILMKKIAQKYGSEALTQLKGNFLWGGHGNTKKVSLQNKSRSSSTDKPRSTSTSSGNVLKHVGAGVGALAQGIAQGAKDSIGITLSLSHKVSNFVAQGITDLVSDETQEQQYNRARSHSGSSEKVQQFRPQPHARNMREGLPQARDALLHDLQGAYDSLLVLTNSTGLTSAPQSSKAPTKISKAIPRAILLPLAGIVRGLGVTLLALRNEIDPLGRQEDKDIESSLSLSKSLYEILEKEESLLREMEGESEELRDSINY